MIDTSRFNDILGIIHLCNHFTCMIAVVCRYRYNSGGNLNKIFYFITTSQKLFVYESSFCLVKQSNTRYFLFWTFLTVYTYYITFPDEEQCFCYKIWNKLFHAYIKLFQSRINNFEIGFTYSYYQSICLCFCLLLKCCVSKNS